VVGRYRSGAFMVVGGGGAGGTVGDGGVDGWGLLVAGWRSWRWIECW
jgi:hypothetical protein